MLPVGVVFALGFDTATEIALLGLAARETGPGLSPWLLLLFPLLFAAGMSLLDSADNALMLRAYGWGLEQPAQRQRYIFVVSAASALVALLTGVAVLCTMIAEQFALEGGAWRALAGLHAHTTWIGAGVVGGFTLFWAAAALLARRARA